VGTRHNYETYFKHVLRKWESSLMEDLKAQPVEEWLHTLPLAPMSCKHVRNVISQLWNFAIFAELVPWTGTGDKTKNFMSHVKVPGGGEALNPAHEFTRTEFGLWVCCLPDPYRLMAVLSLGLSLRIGECLGYKWLDIQEGVDDEGEPRSTISIERQKTMRQITDSLKTKESEKILTLPPVLVRMLNDWRARSFYTAPEDWIFASDRKHGVDSLSYENVLRHYKIAAGKVGIKGKISTHSMRHTCRLWMKNNGESVETMMNAMRHTNLKQMLDYGKKTATPAASKAHAKVAAQAASALLETDGVPN
jgi:integrase